MNRKNTARLNSSSPSGLPFYSSPDPADRIIPPIPFPFQLTKKKNKTSSLTKTVCSRIIFPILLFVHGGISVSYEIKSARFLAAEMLARIVCPGDSVIDATMGNGHDTLFLCKAVGSGGHVYAFDIQPEAVSSTEALLRENGADAQAELFCRGHEYMAEYIPGKVRAVVFNLGWLPGGDHGITTRWETTRIAVEKALDLLLPGGMLVLCAYPGHSEGTRELRELTAFFAALSNKTFNVLHQRFLNAAPGAPECFAVQRMR